MKLDWLKFVRDSQVFLASPRRVGHVTYGGIEIHPSPYGLSIGAEHFKTETGMNRLLITFFEDNRVELHAVISAIEEGLKAPENQTVHPAKPMYHNISPEVTQAAFEKGINLRNAEPESVFFR